jgi:hypothetical protein
MAGLSGHAKSDPIESRGTPIDIMLRGESVTVPSGAAYRVFIGCESGDVVVYRSGGGTTNGEELFEIDDTMDGEKMWLPPGTTVEAPGTNAAGLTGFEVPL